MYNFGKFTVGSKMLTMFLLKSVKFQLVGLVNPVHSFQIWSTEISASLGSDSFDKEYLSWFWWWYKRTWGAVDSSAPSILRFKVRIPSTPSTILPLTVKLSLCWKRTKINKKRPCSGCDSYGRVVASDPRGLLFESNHLQKFILSICLLSTVLKRRK